MNQNISYCFAEPVIIYKNLKIDNNLLLKELETINLFVKIDKQQDSKYFYILDKISSGEKIKKIFNNCFKDAFDKLGYSTNFKIYTSWVTQTKPKTSGGDFHVHSNFWYSGVYYPKITDKLFITFKRPLEYIVQPHIKNYNMFNSLTMDYEIKEHCFIIFPSYLKHTIGFNSSNEDRISIAVNVNPVGYVGSNDSEFKY